MSSPSKGPVEGQGGEGRNQEEILKRSCGWRGCGRGSCGWRGCGRKRRPNAEAFGQKWKILSWPSRPGAHQGYRGLPRVPGLKEKLENKIVVFVHQVFQGISVFFQLLSVLVFSHVCMLGYFFMCVCLLSEIDIQKNKHCMNMCVLTVAFLFFFTLLEYSSTVSLHSVFKILCTQAV